MNGLTPVFKPGNLQFVDEKTAKKIKDKFVQSGDHDFRKRAFVCKHLNNKTKVGFEDSFETSEDMELSDEDDFQAWCYECEIVKKSEGEGNDQSMKFADIKVACEKCYFFMKKFIACTSGFRKP